MAVCHAGHLDVPMRMPIINLRHRPQYSWYIANLNPISWIVFEQSRLRQPLAVLEVLHAAKQTSSPEPRSWATSLHVSWLFLETINL